MSLLKKLIFLLNKPPIILIVGKGRSCAGEAISQVLKSHFKIRRSSGGVLPFVRNKNEVLIFENSLTDSSDAKKFKFLLKRSQLPILVVTRVGEIPPDKYFFSGDRKETFLIRKVAEVLPVQGFLVLNFDDETVREIKNETIAHTLTFGFQEGADFQATDINLNIDGTNFKINYEGGTVPLWLERIFGKEQIYSALSAASVGTIKDINLVEISQALRDYRSLPGKMRLVEGVKKSFVLDDSKNATVFSMIEALETLGKLQTEARKIAVLGDVLGVGKYAIEAHETIGEKVAKFYNLLFTIGPRAKFIAQGAKNKGMLEQNIFQFDTVEQGKVRLQKEIKKGDLILVDGSQEMKMQEIVEEIKAR